jgi:hypothetical protein
MFLKRNYPIGTQDYGICPSKAYRDSDYDNVPWRGVYLRCQQGKLAQLHAFDKLRAVFDLRAAHIQVQPDWLRTSSEQRFLSR